jgi:ATP-dependent HslUV protease subunit HslV
MEQYHGTTILSVRRGNVVAMGGDGQVTLGNIVIKATAKKVRRLYQGASWPVLPAARPTPSRCSSVSRPSWKSIRATSCARLSNWPRTGVPTAPCAGWRPCSVADRESSLIITGNGDVLEPEHGIVAIGSGGAYAQSAARALLENTELPPLDIVTKSLEIAGDLCIYTNRNFTIETLE